MLRQLYRDLGLRRSATQTEIKAAYRDLAKRYHPDKNKAPNADTKFKQVAAAHETLSDPDKRRLYDMYGDDYENVQKQRSQQQQQYRRQDFDPFGRRRPQVPPIFSVTMTLTPENYRDLVEESESSWLLQFYHDHSEPCKEFAQRWEALAHKLSPMVRLGRVRIDDNFGLVQRYRSFLRCRQNAFFMHCDAPALILATVGADGETRAEAYRGGLSAEQVYEGVNPNPYPYPNPNPNPTPNPNPNPNPSISLGPMMTFWFCTMEACKRQGYTATPLGAFVSSGGAALVASSRP